VHYRFAIGHFGRLLDPVAEVAIMCAMPSATTRAVRWGATLLRGAVASVFVIHGVTRTVLGTVGHFGVFLSNSGLPFGTAVAWLLTIVEILGGVAFALGAAVRPLAIWFAVQMCVGILLVHGKEGWFVVGAGRNGAEYSVLIVACLTAVALIDAISYRIAGGRDS
jgi:putative oxidoreductase